LIDWVDDLGKDWGRYLRSKPSGYPQTSVMGRIKEEGWGASIRRHIQSIPIRDIPQDVQEFHCAWQVLGSKHKRIIYVHYGAVCPTRLKWEFIGIIKSTYYARMDKAHVRLWETIEIQTGVQSVQQVQNQTC